LFLQNNKVSFPLRARNYVGLWPSFPAK
jgi:hypothetical protein